MCLFELCVLCLTVCFVNYLLNAFAIYVGLVIVFYLKVIGLLLVFFKFVS